MPSWSPSSSRPWKALYEAWLCLFVVWLRLAKVWRTVHDFRPRLVSALVLGGSADQRTNMKHRNTDDDERWT